MKKVKHELVKLDLLRQAKAWNSAMKKLPKHERELVQSIYYAPYIASYPFFGAGAIAALGGIPYYPVNIPTNALLAGTAASGTGVASTFGLRKHKTRATRKFLKLYHAELARLRKPHHKLKRLI